MRYSFQKYVNFLQLESNLTRTNILIENILIDDGLHQTFFVTRQEEVQLADRYVDTHCFYARELLIQTQRLREKGWRQKSEKTVLPLHLFPSPICTSTHLFSCCPQITTIYVNHMNKGQGLQDDLESCIKLEFTPEEQTCPQWACTPYSWSIIAERNNEVH